MYRKTLIITALICVTLLPACNLTRKSRIESELKGLRPQKESSQGRLDAIKQRLASLQSQSGRLTSELSANHNRTMALLRDNPGTVACIASGAVALSETNAFSSEVKELGAGVGLFCLGIYLLSEDFQRSADNLVSALNEASDREESLKSQINALKPKIDAEARSWQAEKKVFDEVSNKIAGLETELAELTR